MKITLFVIIAISTILVMPAANAQSVPDWVKNTAGWWADGAISESDFVLALQHLINEGIIQVSITTVNELQNEGIPDWVKNTAGWWSQGVISDGEFLNAIQHLIATGVITIQMESELSILQQNLEECSQIVKAYKRSDCKKAAEAELTRYHYKTNGDAFHVGDVTFYYNGNDFEISPSGQPILNISMLAESNSNNNITMMCTGPSICNYDVWNGDKAFKYSGTDFTNGQIVLKPGEARVFSMLFGPNIGYGGTTFEYDSTKEYFFRISEPWGEALIPLNLHVN